MFSFWNTIGNNCFGLHQVTRHIFWCICRYEVLLERCKVDKKAGREIGAMMKARAFFCSLFRHGTEFVQYSHQFRPYRRGWAKGVFCEESSCCTFCHDRQGSCGVALRRSHELHTFATPQLKFLAPSALRALWVGKHHSAHFLHRTATRVRLTQPSVKHSKGCYCRAAALLSSVLSSVLVE